MINVGAMAYAPIVAEYAMLVVLFFLVLGMISNTHKPAKVKTNKPVPTAGQADKVKAYKEWIETEVGPLTK